MPLSELASDHAARCATVSMTGCMTAYDRSMILPESPDLGMLLVRTDYSDDVAWDAVVDAVQAVYPSDDFDRMGTAFDPVESPELEGLDPGALLELPRAGHLSAIAVADARAMTDHTLLFVDFNEYGEPGRTFRAIREQVEAIVANLSIANMDFAEFADNTGPDGTFRGF